LHTSKLHNIHDITVSHSW